MTASEEVAEFLRKNQIKPQYDYSDPVPAVVASDVVCLQFDGGTKNNRPPFSPGYGSYKISNREIVRLQFEQRMSANVAELRTAMAGMIEIQRITPGAYDLHIVGDSQITLNWIRTAYERKDKKISKGASELFKHTIGELRLLLDTNYRIRSLRVEWLPRKYSVQLFGH